MVTKSIAMKSFAEFITGTEAARKRILRGYKYPDDEGMAMAKYYWPAKSTIAIFHQNCHSIEWLLEKASELEKHSLSPSKSLRTKMLSNARSLRSYAKYFGCTKFEVLGTGKFPFHLGGVTINVTPDIHVVDTLGKETYIKYNFSQKKMKYEYVRAIIGCMSYGVHVNLQTNSPDTVAFVDVPTGTVHQGIPVTDALRGEMIARCEELQDEWNAL
ncbi:hypothetical protein Gbem_2975 [Citrifermentans bemidjiense Bem]|uniref:Uncharacterized protein n=1 Tax=Citrifermentans bemidjiense (strain ATCC BAA-1014 / DSM 16622 / JCM 12645 / Bem) TaxID=404380 RepID=B5EJ23_CITBB|nr:hypothetical protein [Citrifermentans bemidjiense]ACH39978.1 hypothetical protein Gbem_2975 [Citrifermentans bemidjiense Bem]